MSNMADDAARFDALAREKGLAGRLSVESYPWPREFYEGLRSYANSRAEWTHRVCRAMPRIVFDFVHEPDINAIAIEDGDRLFIGLNTGTIHLIIDLFYL